VLALPLVEVSAKVRTGPPKDDEEDMSIPVWAGELPLRITTGSPVDDPRLSAGFRPPAYVMQYSRCANFLAQTITQNEITRLREVAEK
jgi:hypothetical protein